MSRFQHIKTEYATGVIGGADYGSRTRVLMRSPTHFIFVALGVHFQKRGNDSYAHTRTLSQETRFSAFSEKAVAQIEETFGKGAAAEAFAALTRKGTGTVLVDGGGDPLPLPHAVQVENMKAQYAAGTCNTEVELPEVLRCRQCDSPLRPHMKAHHMGFPREGKEHPRTIEDCQRITNERVVRISDFGSARRDLWDHVSTFYTWDGESYQDRYFCKTDCAAEYGRRAVLEYAPLPPDGTRAPREVNDHTSTHHYEEEVRVTESGLKY